ncbi:MAG: BACON domain-containing protein, partial [Bacteroidales bacterium]|nr:BACON domain-containing protein [Bacteroidales bacterium]
MKKIAYLIVFASLVSVACAKVDDSQAGFTVQELGLTDHEFVLDALAGHLTFSVYSNQTCTIEVPQEDQGWLRADIQKVFGDDMVIIDYTDNEGFPRMSKVVVHGMQYDMRDTIVFKQQGLTQPTFHFPEGGVVLPGSAAGSKQAAFDLNVDFEDIDIDVRYEGGEGDWVTDISYTGGRFMVSYAANPSSTELRMGQVVLNYVNGWGDTVSSTLNVTQQTSQNKLGLEKTFADVRALGVADTNVKITDNIIITGLVVSDKASRNVGENPKTTFTSIDYTQGDRTVYLESTDGQYGFELLMSTVDDNIFERYDRAQINLNGATLFKGVS